MNFNFKQTRLNCILETKKHIKDSVNDDVLIIQSISSIEELDKIINQISTRFKEWYSYYNPEIVNKLVNVEKLLEKVLTKSNDEIMKELAINDTMVAKLKDEDIDIIIDLAKKVKNLIECREKEKQYIENKMKKLCPNFLKILGVTIGAKILRHSGSLSKLAKTPSTVLQIMGAEKSLFKHMTGRGKSPKYGIIFSHQMIAGVNRKNKGKMARAIADKAALAARIDFFKGEYVADKFLEELNKKYKSLQ